MLQCQKLKKKQPLSPQKVLTVGYLETIEDMKKLSIGTNMFVFSRILFLWAEQNIGFVFEMLSDFQIWKMVRKVSWPHICRMDAYFNRSLGNKFYFPPIYREAEDVVK